MRIAKPTGLALPRLNRSVNLIILYIIPYFLCRRENTCLEDSELTFRASPPTHAPLTFPRMLQVAIRTRGLLRIRFTFPSSESLRKNSYSFFSLYLSGFRLCLPVLRLDN